MTTPQAVKLDSDELNIVVNDMLTHPGKPIRKFDLPTDRTLTVNLTQYDENSIGLESARKAMKAWSLISGITFIETDSEDANITYINENLQQATRTNIFNQSRIWLSSDNSRLNTHLHELGHALGLLHPDRNDPSYDAPYQSTLTTVMAYSNLNETLNIETGSHGEHAPQIADMLAMHRLYGKPDSVNAGDTIYGVGANTGTYMDQIYHDMADNDVYQRGFITIYDTEGFDTIDFSTDGSDQNINLNPQWVSFTYSSIGKECQQGVCKEKVFYNTFTIGPDTIIEKYVAGTGNDDIVGNVADNVLLGNGGNDTLEGGPGADTLDGGPGEDTASYKDSPAAVLVRLHDAGAVKSGDAKGDTLTGIEHLAGSAHNDVLAGDGGDNILKGGNGHDDIYGGPAGGDDTLYGGKGDDRLFGGKGDDTLTGGAGNDLLKGGPGKDTLIADGNELDILHGGPGRDIFVFAPSDLGGGTIQDFTDGEDLIDLTAFNDIASITDLDVTPLGDNVHIELADTDYLTMIILSDFDAGNLDDSDFVFVA